MKSLLSLQVPILYAILFFIIAPISCLYVDRQIDDVATRVVNNFLSLQLPADNDLLNIRYILNNYNPSLCSIELNLLLIQACYKYSTLFENSLYQMHARCTAIHKGLQVPNALHTPELIRALEDLRGWVNKIPPLPYGPIDRTLSHLIECGSTSITPTEEIEEIARLIVVPKTPAHTTLLLAKAFWVHRDSIKHAVHRARFFSSQVPYESLSESDIALADEIKKLLENHSKTQCLC